MREVSTGYNIYVQKKKGSGWSWYCYHSEYSGAMSIANRLSDEYYRVRIRNSRGEEVATFKTTEVTQ